MPVLDPLPRAVDGEIVAKTSEWFAREARDLPWRGAPAWQVLVSEFMLQQTPVARVLPVYREWVTRWPIPSALAAEPVSEAIRAWGRLGYPRRALRLHAVATILDRDFDDEVPSDVESLRSLPGVGDYTAAAIQAFAFGKRSIVIDTNIRRVLARAVNGTQWPTLSLSVAERSLAESLVPHTDLAAAQWSAAVMELGAVICTAAAPACEVCPILEQCAWYAAGTPQSSRPHKTQAWHGTDRQCRGKILQLLRESESDVTENAVALLWPDSLQLQKCLAALVSEGFISPTKHGWTLTSA